MHHPPLKKFKNSGDQVLHVYCMSIYLCCTSSLLPLSLSSSPPHHSSPLPFISRLRLPSPPVPSPGHGGGPGRAVRRRGGRGWSRASGTASGGSGATARRRRSGMTGVTGQAARPRRAPSSPALPPLSVAKSGDHGGTTGAGRRVAGRAWARPAADLARLRRCGRDGPSGAATASTLLSCPASSLARSSARAAVARRWRRGCPVAAGPDGRHRFF